MDSIKKLLGVLVFLTGCATSTPQQQGMIWTNDLQDVDTDGVPAGQDACPGTPSGTKAISRGCAAIEIARNPDIFLTPALTLIGKARRALLALPALRDMSNQLTETLERGGSLLERGGYRISRGEICDGAAQVEQGLVALIDAHRVIGATVSRLRREIQVSRLPGGDADERDLLWHELSYRSSLVDRAVAETRRASEVMTSICRTVVNESSIDATVQATEDATGTLRLEYGRVVGLARGDQAQPIAEGILVTASGVLFHDGSLYATNVVPISVADNIPQLLTPCLSLRVAPDQPFWPPNVNIDPQDVTLHNPLGYMVDSLLRLEIMMRLGVELGSCPTDGKSIRYSAEISMAYKDQVTQMTLTTVLGSDLTPGEHPVALPMTLDPGVTATITIYKGAEAELHVW